MSIDLLLVCSVVSVLTGLTRVKEDRTFGVLNVDLGLCIAFIVFKGG